MNLFAVVMLCAGALAGVFAWVRHMRPGAPASSSDVEKPEPTIHEGLEEATEDDPPPGWDAITRPLPQPPEDSYEEQIHDAIESADPDDVGDADYVDAYISDSAADGVVDDL